MNRYLKPTLIITCSMLFSWHLSAQNKVDTLHQNIVETNKGTVLSMPLKLKGDTISNVQFSHLSQISDSILIDSKRNKKPPANK